MLINIRANWENAKKGFNSVLNHARGIGSGIGGAFGRLKNALGSIAGTLGMGMGAAAAVAGARKLVNAMDDIEDNAPKIGVSFAYFQKMQYAADQSGTSFQAVTAAMARLKKTSGELAAGQKKATDTFAMLGMTAKDIAGMDTGQIFDEVTKRLNAMEDPLLRDAAASALFGRNFMELNNYIADHLKFGADLEARGGIIADEHIIAASAFNDAICDIGYSLKAWSVNSGFIAQLLQVAEGLNAIVSNSKKMESYGITSNVEEHAKKEGWLAKATRKTLNFVSFSGALASDGRGLGDKLFGVEAEKMTTAPIDRAEVKRKLAEHDADVKRKEQVNKAAKFEARLRGAVTARSREAELKALDEAQKKAEGKAKPKDAALKKAQASVAGKAASDSLQRIGGYSGGGDIKAAQALDAAKRQVDILTQVDKKLGAIEAAAKSGGLVFP